MGVEFLLTSLVVVLLPGTGVLYTLAVGLGQGFKPSIAAAFGCTLGILPAAFASIVGLAALLHASAVAFQVIKYLGVAYLFYMAWSILRESGALSVSEERRGTDTLRLIRNGMLLNVLNPKLSLFFPGLPSAICVGRYRQSHRQFDWFGAGFHGNDLCGLCRLRRVRILGTGLRNFPA